MCRAPHFFIAQVWFSNLPARLLFGDGRSPTSSSTQRILRRNALFSIGPPSPLVSSEFAGHRYLYAPSPPELIRSTNPHVRRKRRVITAASIQFVCREA